MFPTVCGAVILRFRIVPCRTMSFLSLTVMAPVSKLHADWHCDLLFIIAIISIYATVLCLNLYGMPKNKISYY